MLQGQKIYSQLETQHTFRGLSNSQDYIYYKISNVNKIYLELVLIVIIKKQIYIQFIIFSVLFLLVIFIIIKIYKVFYKIPRNLKSNG